MKKIHGQIRINRPAAVVSNYATTPRTWTEWYPLTKSVSGTIDHSPEPGETWDEIIKMGSFQYTAHWKTIEKALPAKYVYEGSSDKGGFAKITYTFTETDGVTLFDRVLLYEPSSFLMRILDLLFIRRKIETASNQALDNMKRILETR